MRKTQDEIEKEEEEEEIEKITEEFDCLMSRPFFAFFDLKNILKRSTFRSNLLLNTF
jgi:hypothetical protein